MCSNRLVLKILDRAECLGGYGVNLPDEPNLALRASLSCGGASTLPRAVIGSESTQTIWRIGINYQ